MKSNIVIILTSTVNINNKLRNLYQTDKDERLTTYMKSILKWLNETNFNIILVENSGYEFKELECEKNKYNNRFEIITYDEKEINKDYLQDNKSKGTSELFSINYAYNNSILIKKITSVEMPLLFIIKITGRFFIPELEEYFKTINFSEYDCLIQNKNKHCEMIGCNVNQIENIFNCDLSDVKYLNSTDFIENIYYNRILLHGNKVLRCKSLPIEPTQRGGVNEIYCDI